MMAGSLFPMLLLGATVFGSYQQHGPIQKCLKGASQPPLMVILAVAR
jgi:hypothetical protein